MTFRDEEAEKRQKVLDELKRMSSREVFEAAVEAGIYTPDGKLTPSYRPRVARRRPR
jgi:hypothetical protein